MATGVEAYMPLFVGDYFAETMGMSLEERGAYGFLLPLLWRNGGAYAEDHHRLALACGATRDQWDRVWQAISALFITGDGTIRHEKLSELLQDSVIRKEKRTNAAKIAAQARYGSNTDRTPAASASHANGMRDECPSTSTLTAPTAPAPAPSSEETSAPLSAAPPTPPEWALEFADRLRQLCHDHRGKHLKRFADDRYPKTRLSDAVEIERIVTRDGRKEIEITQVFAFLKAEVPSKDNFTWREQVQSGAGLREKFEKIEDAIRRKTGKPLSDGLVQWYDPHKGIIRVTPQERDRLKAELNQAKADRHAEMYGAPADGALAQLVSGIGRRV